MKPCISREVTEFDPADPAKLIRIINCEVQRVINMANKVQCRVTNLLISQSGNDVVVEAYYDVDSEQAIAAWEENKAHEKGE